MTADNKKKNERLSLAKCKATLSKAGLNYTDTEILEIRDYLYQLAEIDYTVFMYSETDDELNNCKNENQNTNEKGESDTLGQAA